VTGPDVALRETCRLVGGRVPLWPYHRARLASGGCDDALLREADALVAREAGSAGGANVARRRLTLVASPDGLVDAVVQRRLSSLDVPGGPVAVIVEAAGAPPLPRSAAKPADRSWWDEAQRRARAAGGHQAIIVGPDGSVLDGGSANVWAVVDDVLLTPPAPTAVAGVARAFLFDALARAGAPARVGSVGAATVEAADELFLTNAYGGAVAVRGRGGPVFERVRALFDDVWRG
jgi:branched-subunit amino acid aminotransferase/4-amino-4-deoxychorismate lyase